MLPRPHSMERGKDDGRPSTSNLKNLLLPSNWPNALGPLGVILLRLWKSKV